MLKHAITILYILLFSAIGVGQNLEKGFKRLQKNDLRAADRIFTAIVEEEPQNAAAHYGLCMIYANPDYRNVDYFKAYEHIREAETYYNTQRDRKYVKKTTIKAKKRIVDNQIFDYVKKFEKPEIVRQFIENYPESQHINEAEKYIVQLNFNKARNENTIKALQHFIDQYPNSKYVDTAQQLIAEIKFKETCKTNTINAYNQFIEEFNNATLVQQAKEKRDALAFIQASKKNTQEAYSDFIRNYPDAKQAGIAKQRRTAFDNIKPEIPTFRGNEKRNFYGNEPPESLDLQWKLNLGSGKSKVYGFTKYWAGAGWTGQPLLINENGTHYIIQGAYDYHLRKMEAETGKVVWEYKFDDIVKGTGTIWINQNADEIEKRYMILQGSRYGFKNDWKAKIIPSFRAISYISGNELWRMNVKRTFSYSRDVDASPLVINDTAYIGLENGIFTVFNPDCNQKTERRGMKQPVVYQELMLYSDRDPALLDNGINLVTESSPAKLGNRIYIASCNRVYGYNLNTRKFDWIFFIGSDIDGSPVITSDSCLLISVEKQYIKGKGGLFKLDPSKAPENAVVWYFATDDWRFGEWEGGIVGTAAVNDYYRKEDEPALAAFIGIDGYLYVVNHTLLSGETNPGPGDSIQYPKPKLIFKKNIGPSISSPIIVDNKLIAASSLAIYLFEFDENMNFRLIDKKSGIFEASPIVWNGKVYIASRNGYLYCFGNKN